jgi:hypothetical protein
MLTSLRGSPVGLGGGYARAGIRFFPDRARAAGAAPPGP